jgi:hypothetical protein
MPTKRRRRMQAFRSRLTPALERYLVTGDYCGDAEIAPDLGVFLLAGHVIRGDLDELQALWAEHGAELRRQHPGARLFAEETLRRRNR